MGTCDLVRELVGESSALEEAWQLLPEHGEGFVVCADSNRRFHTGEKTGFLLEAEVSTGPSTTLLRSDDGHWSAWKWQEVPGESYRWVEHIFLSSEPSANPASLRYRQYWTRQEESGLQVWRPVGARFCGFVQEEK